MTIADNVAHVWDRVHIALARAGRSDNITLVAVTKRQTVEAINEAHAAGLAEFGENYVQEAQEKRTLLPQDGDARWHLIGHLQGNKAKIAVGLFDVIQSVDSVRLAATIGRHAAAAGKTQDILMQVHLGTEETKFGLFPKEMPDAAVQVMGLPGVRLQGLMGIAPLGEDPRPHFRVLRQLFDKLPDTARQTLSMGMTADFETAIEEGATLLRIGTALFGPRI